jgi:glutamate synthase domain-containing protein 3
MKTIDAQGSDLKHVNAALRKNVNGQPVTVINATRIHGLAAGLHQGEVVVRGDAGDYLGMLTDGATIRVTRNAGKYVADNMTCGRVIIQGDAAIGAAQYCYGGTVIIYGDAADFTATMNKGATIIVAGDVGDEAATYMLNGELIVVGDAGENFANYLIQGAVYIGGRWKSLGHNTQVVPLTEEDIDKVGALLTGCGIETDASQFKKVVAASKKPFYK